MKKCPQCHLVSPDSTPICACGFNLENQPIETILPKASEVDISCASDIPDYFTQAILCLLFCCLPFGMVALYYSGKAKTRKELGDITGATADSKRARLWCRIAFWTGAAIIIIWTIVNDFSLL